MDPGGLELPPAPARPSDDDDNMGYGSTLKRGSLLRTASLRRDDGSHASGCAPHDLDEAESFSGPPSPDLSPQPPPSLRAHGAFERHDTVETTSSSQSGGRERSPSQFWSNHGRRGGFVMQRASVNWRFIGWMTCTAIFLAIVLAGLDDREAPWAVGVFSALLVVQVALTVAYFNKFGSRLQMRVMLNSLLFWQITFASATSAVVSMLEMVPLWRAQTIPKEMLMFAVFMAGPVLDAAVSTRREALSAVIVLVFGAMLVMLSALLRDEDAVLYQGASQSNATGLWVRLVAGYFLCCCFCFCFRASSSSSSSFSSSSSSSSLTLSHASHPASHRRPGRTVDRGACSSAIVAHTVGSSSFGTPQPSITLTLFFLSCLPLPASLLQLEVKRTCMSLLLSLLLGSVKDAISDGEHSSFYFVKECRLKPTATAGSPDRRPCCSILCE